MNKITSLDQLATLKLPSHIKNDHKTFIAFMNAYYEFLDNQKLTRNLESVKDIDSTLDEFLSYIKNEIGVLAPRMAEDRFFLKHARENYASRGSEESYKCLFRLMYNKDVDIQYPNEKLFKISGGIWEQPVSFFLKVETGDVYKLENNYIKVAKVNSDEKYKVYVKRIIKVSSTTDVYEIFIDRNFFGDIVPYSSVSYDGVVGTIQPTISKIKIKKSGSGFKIGQVYSINNNVGYGCQIKITEIGSLNDIKKVQVINFGYGYKTNFDYDIVTRQIKPTEVTISKIGKHKYDINMYELLPGAIDNGLLNKVDYHQMFVEGDYVGDVLGNFYDITSTSENKIIKATLTVEIGGLSKYPGYYQSSSGLLSDDSYIQDGYYYQDFSYIIKIDEKLDDYIQTVKNYIHPVGRKIFGEYVIESEYTLIYEILDSLIKIFLPLESDPYSDDAAIVSDKTILSRHIKQLETDSIFQIESEAKIVILKVTLNGNMLPADDATYPWYASEDNIIHFYRNIPSASDVIMVEYAITGNNPNAKDVFIDLVKHIKNDNVVFFSDKKYHMTKPLYIDISPNDLIRKHVLKPIDIDKVSIELGVPLKNIGKIASSRLIEFDIETLLSYHLTKPNLANEHVVFFENVNKHVKKEQTENLIAIDLGVTKKVNKQITGDVFTPNMALIEKHVNKKPESILSPIKVETQYNLIKPNLANEKILLYSDVKKDVKKQNDEYVSATEVKVEKRFARLSEEYVSTADINISKDVNKKFYDIQLVNANTLQKYVNTNLYSNVIMYSDIAVMYQYYYASTQNVFIEDVVKLVRPKFNSQLQNISFNTNISLFRNITSTLLNLDSVDKKKIDKYIQESNLVTWESGNIALNAYSREAYCDETYTVGVTNF